MSAIQAALAAATDINPSKRSNETVTDQAYLKRLALGVQDLPDDEWNKLGQEAQDWFNQAADAIEKKTDIPAFPDLVKAEPAARRRGSSASAEVKPMTSADAKKGMKVVITTKRGKEYTGEVVEADDQGLVLEVDGKDVELDHDKIDKISLVGAGSDAEPEPMEPEVGDTVEVVTKRGKKIMGNIVELTDEDMVLKDAAGEPHELSKDRLESVVVKVKNAKASGSTSRAGGKAESTSNTPKADAEPAGRASAKANGGVSVTTRIRELIAENLDAKKEDISAALKKGGLEFKQATLDLTFGDMHKIVGILRDRKLLK